MDKSDVLEIVKARIEENKRGYEKAVVYSDTAAKVLYKSIILENEILLNTLEEKLTEQPKTKYKYIAVRSFGPSIKTGTQDLENLLEDGWEFVNASEYVPSEKRGAEEFSGYIEYILRREERE